MSSGNLGVNQERSLTTTLLTAFVLGLFAGLAPGPYTTMVAGTALERGFKAGFLLALTPLLTDVPPMLFSTLLLERSGWTGLTILGIAGGAVILVVGIRFLRGHPGEARPFPSRGEPVPAPPGGRRQSAQIGHVALSTLLNPSPWIFWLLVASPLLLRSFGRSRVEGVVFLVVIFGTNISTTTGLAWIASHSRKVLSPAFQRLALQAVGATLILAGTFLLWQSSVGGFQTLIDQQGKLRSAVEQNLPSK